MSLWKLPSDVSILLKNYFQFLTQILLQKVRNAVLLKELNLTVSLDSQIELHTTPVKFDILAKHGLQRNGI